MADIATSPMAIMEVPHEVQNVGTEAMPMQEFPTPSKQSPKEVRDEQVETDPVQISPISEPTKFQVKKEPPKSKMSGGIKNDPFAKSNVGETNKMTKISGSIKQAPVSKSSVTDNRSPKNRMIES